MLLDCLRLLSALLLPLWAFAPVPVGAGPLLVERVVGVDVSEDAGVRVGVAMRDSKSSVSCVAEGLADSSDENVLFNLARPTLATGSGAVIQQMLTWPKVLVHCSLKKLDQLTYIQV